MSVSSDLIVIAIKKGDNGVLGTFEEWNSSVGGLVASVLVKGGGGASERDITLGVFVGLPIGVACGVNEDGTGGNSFVGIGRAEPSFDHGENISEKGFGGRIIFERFKDATIDDTERSGALVVVENKIGKRGAWIDSASAVGI